jgi:hypothetical protein
VRSWAAPLEHADKAVSRLALGLFDSPRDLQSVRGQHRLDPITNRRSHARIASASILSAVRNPRASVTFLGFVGNLERLAQLGRHADPLQAQGNSSPCLEGAFLEVCSFK